MPDSTFKRFGKYEIQAELGRGGFGRVFRAFDPTVGRPVAIKILTSEAGSDVLTRFRNEAIAAGSLRHENIVTMYEFGEENGVPFIAMEYLEGEDLQQAIRSRRKLTLLEKIQIMAQTASGLECAHRHGVVHRDVKPANIRLLPDGAVKILDFGIARLIRDDGAARLTHQGHVIGTLLYMAPEQVMGSDTDALCDIFAYGAVFYELLTGEHPFRAEDPRSIFYKITNQDPELIHRLVPDCPESLDRVVRRALHKDRELRYQSLLDLRLDIEPVLIQLRRDRAASLVADANRLLVARNLEASCSLLNEVIDLDPANQAARQMRESIQVELRKRLLRPRIDGLIAKAETSIAEENYSQAVEILKSALRLAPDDETLKVRCREAKFRRDQSRRLAEKLGKAKELLAHDSVDEALAAVGDLQSDERQTMEARELFARLAARAAGKLRLEAAEEAQGAERADPDPEALPTGKQLDRGGAPSYRKFVFIGAACALAIAACFTGMRILRPRAVASIVTIVTEPPGAEMRVGERSCSAAPGCRLELPAGNYRITARLPGYTSASQELSVGRARNSQVRLVLAPLPTSLVITSNIAAGSVLLDGRAAGPLIDGQFTLRELRPGLHRLRIAGPGSEASMVFKTAPARVPELVEKAEVHNAIGITAMSMGPIVRATCAGCEGELLVDGKPPNATPIAVGEHEVTARGAGEPLRVFFRNGDAPRIAIQLTSISNPQGTLVIEANVDGALILIDRRRLSRQTQSGRLTLPLEPGGHTIELQKQGYRVNPERLVARIRKGAEFRAAFRLDPKPATLVLSPVQEGATVLIDGAPVGVVQGGSFSTDVSPGLHTVGLAKEGYRTVSIQSALKPGDALRLSDAVLRLEPLPPPQTQKAVVQPPQSLRPRPEDLEANEWAAVRLERDRAAIQAFLRKYPNTARRRDALQLLAQMDWDALDHSDPAALERFRAQHGDSPLAQQAASEIERIQKEAIAKAQKSADDQLAADRREISKVLALYGTAFDRNDLNLLKSIWPRLPEADLAQAFRSKGTIRSELRPLGPAEVSGDRATVRCTRRTEQITEFGRQRPVEQVLVVGLDKKDGRWVISAVN